MSVPTAISETSWQNIPLKGRTDFRVQPNSGHRDYSRLSCGVRETQLGPNVGSQRRCLRGGSVDR
jgi:hypothetical protein